MPVSELEKKPDNNMNKMKLMTNVKSEACIKLAHHIGYWLSHLLMTRKL